MSDIHLPAEWAPIERIYTAWPWRRREWREPLGRAQSEVAAFAKAVAKGGTAITLLVPDKRVETAAREQVGDAPVDIARTRYGDIWLRDTSPLFHAEGAAAFQFNGWGEKFVMPGDERVAAMLAKREDVALTKHDMVLEGGAIDHDGTGLAITTEQCLLNPNRNGDISREGVEKVLAEALGLTRVVWLGRGLAGDHTDGHIDNLARFVAPGKVVLPQALDTDDPNSMVYESAAATLDEAGIETVRIPSAGLVKDEEGKPMPASYMNFVLTNERVIIPTYRSSYDDRAVDMLGQLFPDRDAIGLGAKAILSGGGAFHCMTREVPAI
ncbi:MAG: agmatine deiminase family protein [Pacificimonas sp.]